MGGTGLGEAIGRQLVSLGLTQSSLARRAGISQPYLSQLERGTRKRISYGPLRRLADALGVTMTALMEKEASSMPRRGRTEFWLYQMRPRVDWGLPDYLRDVREGRLLAGHWDESASKVYKLGGRLRFRALPPTRTLQSQPCWSAQVRALIAAVRTSPEGTMWRVTEPRHVRGLLTAIFAELGGNWLRDWTTSRTPAGPQN